MALEGYLHSAAIPRLPHLSERSREPRNGPSSISGEVVPPRRPGSPSQDGSVTPRQPRTSFFGGKGGSFMERIMTAYWDEDREELEVRRPTGQVFRFSARQAVAGGHEVFGVQVIDNEIWVLTGAAGSRRPTWKVRYTQTGTYRGTSAL